MYYPLSGKKCFGQIHCINILQTYKCNKIFPHTAKFSLYKYNMEEKLAII